ncbi:Hypothetical_protein [Hexamita inflata]|uniref:Hypothetical_protein n=1 Tax=Hexamita inflata TaxID=28002 RepID=A0ABP1HKG2_9EUKA
MITYRNAQSQTEMNLTVWRTLEFIKLYEQFEGEACDVETQVNFQLEQVEQLSQDELLIIQKRLQREKNGIHLKGKGMPTQDNFYELCMQNQEFFIEIAMSPDLDLFLLSFEEKETQMNVDEQFLKKFETFVFNKIAYNRAFFVSSQQTKNSRQHHQFLLTLKHKLYQKSTNLQENSQT